MYVFFSWDDTDPAAELDIRGEQYIRLIDVCFQFCSYFTLNESRAGTFFDLPDKELDHWPAQQYPPVGKTHLFFCSGKAKDYLQNKVGSLFSWFSWEASNQGKKERLLPEDLCFYRSDGSIFLWSETHEGICALLPKDEEDVSSIISSVGWSKYVNDDIFGALKNLEDYNIFLENIK